jgi:hypothetical protein
MMPLIMQGRMNRGGLSLALRSDAATPKDTPRYDRGS